MLRSSQLGFPLKVNPTVRNTERAANYQLRSAPSRVASCESRHSKYGYSCDVRATYAHLRCQPLWTWITGKSLWKGEPRHPRETLLREWQLWCQLGWAWSIILLSIFVAGRVCGALEVNLGSKAIVVALCWLLVVNRTRGLLHTFHYTNHGASIANMKRAKWIAKYFMSIPILHTPWESYHTIHAQDHHALKNLCTDQDPDQQFMIQHGFYKGMSEREFWLRVVFAPLLPTNIWKHFRFRLMQNFVVPEWSERIPRAAFWLLLFGAAYLGNFTYELTLFYLVPLILLTQHSSWIQHVTEHLWFAERPEGISQFVYYASLTWGRFLGRPHPGSETGLLHAARLLKWWSLVMLVDIPVRLYSFMQDLPSHDFHHRSPRVNFWSIATERAAAEGRLSKFGPMAETWSVGEALLVLRDFLCRGEEDPFGIYDWARSQPGMVAAE
jgi:hypothetical protein